MEIEKFWNNLPSFANVEFNNNGKFNYGCITKKPSRDYKKRYIRKARRQMRKYGFDSSETWNLDYTIMTWLSDNFGGFFRICGCPDNWGHYDLDGNDYDFWKYRNTEGYYEKMKEWNTTRYDSFYKHLRDFLNNLTDDNKKKLSNFCCPRLRYLAKHMHGWPAGNDFPKFEDWKNEIENMACKLEEGTYSEYFITYFFNLWD